MGDERVRVSLGASRSLVERVCYCEARNRDYTRGMSLKGFIKLSVMNVSRMNVYHTVRTSIHALIMN